MTRIRPAAFAVVVAGSMLLGGVVGAVAYGASTVAALAASPAATASPAAPGAAPTSNEDATHEKGETAAQETAENNGTARHGGGPGAGGAPNEDPAHEAGESAAREAQEHAAKPAAPTATPTPGT